jgi:hypothetical protein
MFIDTRTNRMVIMVSLFIPLIVFDSEDVVMRALFDNVGDTAATAGYLILCIIPE